MSKVTTTAITKVATVAAGLALGVSMLASTAYAAGLNTTQVNSILSLLSSFGADSATIANVQAALTGQPSTGGTTTGSTGSSSYTFTRDLTVGSSGADVTALQNWLNAQGYLKVSATGYFGSATQAAVVAWQKVAGLTPAAGYFGAKSRAALSSVSTGGSTGSTGGTTVPVGTGTGLKVMLSPTSPNGTVLVAGQGIGKLGDYVFANPTSAPITVTGLSFNRTGVSNDQTLNNVYLYSAGTRLTDSAGVSNSAFSFTNAAGLFTVQAGQTYTVSVRADIATGTAGQQLGVSLVNVAQSGTLDASAVFPIMSGFQTVSAANLATVQFSASSNTLPQGTNISIAPQPNYTVWQNSVSISTNPVKLASLAFTNLGSIGSSNIGNFRLFVDGTQVGSAVPSFNGSRQVIFDLSASPVMLSTQSHVIKVLADVTGGSSLTFDLSLQRSSDAMFIDNQLNQPVTPTTSGSTNFTAVTPSQVTVQSVSGTTGGVSVSKDPSSQTNSIAAGASNVNWATFDVLASGEPTKVMDLYVCAATSTLSATGPGGLKNGKVFFNGVQVGSTKDIVACNNLTNSSAYTDFGLGSSMILPAGQTAKIDIYADAKFTDSSNIPSAQVVKVHIVPSKSNAQGQNSLNPTGVPFGVTGTDGDSLGNGVAIAASTLSASKFSGYANQTVIPGAQNALLGEFTLAAGSTEGINVNTIGINASSTALTYLQNISLKDMSTGSTLGSVISTPSASNSFSLGSNLVIPASGTKTIGIYGNILSNAGSATYNPLFAVDAVGTSGTGAVTGNSASIGTTAAANVYLQQIITGTGSLVGALGASSPVASNVVAGASSLQIADYSFSANNSSYTIQKLEVAASTTAAAAINSLTLKYTDANGTTQTATLSGPSGTSGNNTLYDFTGLTMFVPANGSSDVTVWVSTPTISAGGSGISGATIVTALTPSTTGFQAQDQSGSLNQNGANSGGTGVYTISQNSIMSNGTNGYGSLVVRKSVATFAGQSNSTNAQPTAGNTLYQFTVSADPAGAVDFYKMSFQTATSVMSASGFKLYDQANPSTALNTTGVNADSNGVVSIVSDQVIQIPAGGSKTFILRATTVSGWATSASLQINLAAADTGTAPAANVAANDSSLNTAHYVWTDRAQNSDAIATTEWTNGFLLRDLVSGVYTFTHS